VLRESVRWDTVVFYVDSVRFAVIVTSSGCDGLH